MVLEKINNWSPNTFTTTVLVMTAWSEPDLREVVLSMWSPIMDGTTQKEKEILTEGIGI